MASPYREGMPSSDEERRQKFEKITYSIKSALVRAQFDPNLTNVLKLVIEVVTGICEFVEDLYQCINTLESRIKELELRIEELKKKNDEYVP